MGHNISTVNEFPGERSEITRETLQPSPEGKMRSWKRKQHIALTNGNNGTGMLEKVLVGNKISGSAKLIGTI